MAESQSSGLDSFFSGIQSFVLDADRHLGRSSEMYAVYVIERMEVCLSSWRDLSNFTSDYDEENLSEEEIRLTSAWRENVIQLLSCLESLAVLWEGYYQELVRTSSIAVNAYR